MISWCHLGAPYLSIPHRCLTYLFQIVLQGRVWTTFLFPMSPTDADNGRAISRWALNEQANAIIVAFIETPEDVALAIAYARENHLPIAMIRGGGHDIAGASSTDSLVTDLSSHLL